MSRRVRLPTDTGRRHERPIQYAVWGILAIGILSIGSVCVLAISGIRVNWTPSVAIGMYRIKTDRVQETLRPETIVIACLPIRLAIIANTAGYLTRGMCPSDVMPIGKYILALPGDTVRVTSDGFMRNGQRIPGTQLHQHDRHGHPLHPIAIGTYPVPPGLVWLYTPHTHSWDSRYWGPIPITAIQATLTPVWTIAPTSRQAQQPHTATPKE